MQPASVATTPIVRRRLPRRELVPLDCIVCSTTIVSPLVICTECLHAWAAALAAKAPDDAGWRWRRKVVQFYLSRYGPSVPGFERAAAGLVDAALRRALHPSSKPRPAAQVGRVVTLLGLGAALGLGSVLLLSIVITLSLLVIRLVQVM